LPHFDEKFFAPKVLCVGSSYLWEKVTRWCVGEFLAKPNIEYQPAEKAAIQSFI
jgi:hypothetical protein